MAEVEPVVNSEPNGDFNTAPKEEEPNAPETKNDCNSASDVAEEPKESDVTNEIQAQPNGGTDSNSLSKSSVGSASTGSPKFNMVHLNNCFLSCMEEEHLKLKDYCEGFREILNFFSLLGKGFSFVSADVKEKVDIIDAHSTGPRAEEYVLIRDCMEMEKGEGIANMNTTTFASASRTVLRLHRAMEFIAKLFKAMAPYKEESIGELTRTVYKDTLAKFHPFFVRKPAEMAMRYGIPYRKKLLQQMSTIEGQPSIPEEDIESQMLNASETMLRCHAILEKFYSDLQMHKLP